MTTIDMSERLTIYQRVVAHFAPLYDLYTRAGVRYPLVVFRPDPDQRDDVDTVLGDVIMQFEDPADFARQLSTRYLTGVPIEELNTYLQSLAGVTAEEARAAAAQYIDTEQPIIVVVGNAELVKPQLEELGEVVMVDKDGQVVEE